MSVVRRTDGLLSGPQTISLFGMLRGHAGGRSKDHLIRNLAAIHSSSWSRAANSILFLCELGALVHEDGHVRFDAQFDSDPEAWPRQLSFRIAHWLAARIALGAVGQSIQSLGSTRELWLDSKILPEGPSGIGLWLIEFGVAEREAVSSRFWRVRSAYQELFLEAARSSNREIRKRLIASAQLEAKLIRDSELGLEAEEWVVRYERDRLRDHPLVDQIRRISDENVTAGYDILSFSSVGMLQHDLFIEVKSYSEIPHFYWSANEVATAKMLDEAYSLYLVDRSQMQDSDYVPRIISGPHAALMVSCPDEWSMRSSVFEFTLRNS